MTEVWRDPWESIEGEVADAMLIELKKELCVGHLLHGKECQAVARRFDRDDVVFKLTDGDFALVHLTWKSKQETDPQWPSTTIYATVDELQSDDDF